VSNARGALSAGRLFRCNGECVRPAQDCAGRHSSAIALQRMTGLGSDEYGEEPWARVGPGWVPALVATHTWDRIDGLTVVNGVRRVVRGPR
jgi:hypothetical protein